MARAGATGSVRHRWLEAGFRVLEQRPDPRNGARHVGERGWRRTLRKRLAEPDRATLSDQFALDDAHVAGHARRSDLEGDAKDQGLQPEAADASPPRSVDLADQALKQFPAVFGAGVQVEHV